MARKKARKAKKVVRRRKSTIKYKGVCPAGFILGKFNPKTGKAFKKVRCVNTKKRARKLSVPARVSKAHSPFPLALDGTHKRRRRHKR